MYLFNNSWLTQNGVIAFTKVPNILSYVEGNNIGTAASLRIDRINNAVADDKFTINGITFVAKSYPSNANEWETGNTPDFARMLRNSQLAANYRIYLDAQTQDRVWIVARQISSAYNIVYSFSEPYRNVQFTLHDGTSSGDYSPGTVFYVDLYAGDDYITTLQKTFYNTRVDFDVSSLLTSTSKYDTITPFKLYLYGGNMHPSQGYTVNGYAVPGYMCNQGKPYLMTTDTETRFAQNVSRGTQTEVYNRTTLYTYLPSITFVAYNGISSIGIDYLDSAKHSIRSEIIYPDNASGFGYHTIVVPLTSQYFNEAYYIDISIASLGTVRYNVIKPLDATARCQRIYWHNSYGGVSFFDFTGKISEEHKTSKTTYTKNIFDYYTDTSKEQTKVYGNDTSITVTMESHLMERSAVWLFNDLLSAYDVWTTINGVDYKIIVQSVKCDEQETGVWKATITYTYSLI